MGKKAAIFDATLSLIVEEGLQAVTLAKILDKADAGSGTLYNYFSSKDALLYEMYLKLKEKMENYVLSDYDDSAGVRLRFNQLLTRFLEYNIQNYDEQSFFEQYAYILRKSKPDDSAFNGPFKAATAQIYMEGQKQKIILDLDITILNQIASGIIISIVKGYKSNKYELDELTKQKILDICWNSIRA
jgi:AcrR family transcriptional regulator